MLHRISQALDAFPRKTTGSPPPDRNRWHQPGIADRGPRLPRGLDALNFVQTRNHTSGADR